MCPQKLPYLGELQTIEVFEYYDRPVLFACQNRTGAVYLAVWADEIDRQEIWLYVSMSSNRFAQVRSGRIDLHDAYRLSEDESVFRVKVDSSSGDVIAVEAVPAAEISEELLPDRGEALQLPTKTMSPLDQPIENVALQKARDVVRLRLKLPEDARTEIAIQAMSRILSTFQSAVTNIAAALKGLLVRRGPIPDEVVTPTRFMFVGAGPGSFEIELASATYGYLFNEFESDAGKAVGKIIALLKVSTNEQRLQADLKELGFRAAGTYGVFLAALQANTLGVQITRGAPKRRFSESVTVGSDDIAAAIDTIRTSESRVSPPFPVYGTLAGASLVSNTFEIKDTRADRLYRGEVLPEAEAAIGRATLSRQYRAILRSVTRIDLTTGEEKIQYQMVAIEPFGWNQTEHE